MQVVVVHALGELFAVPVTAVREVVRAAPRRTLPSAVPWVAGVADVRGRMLPVVDLGARLGHRATGIDGDLLVVEAGGVTAAVAVERVLGLETIPDGGLAPPPIGTTEAAAGIALVGDRLVLVLRAVALVPGEGRSGSPSSSAAEPTATSMGPDTPEPSDTLAEAPAPALRGGSALGASVPAPPADAAREPAPALDGLGAPAQVASAPTVGTGEPFPAGAEPASAADAGVRHDRASASNPDRDGGAADGHSAPRTPADALRAAPAGPTAAAAHAPGAGPAAATAAAAAAAGLAGSGGGFVLESGRLGPCLVARAPWSAAMTEAAIDHDVRELVLDEARGWDGFTVDFLADLPALQAVRIRHRSVRDISAVHALPDLRDVEVLTRCRTPIDAEAFPSLERCALRWRAKARSILTVRGLRELVLTHYPGPDLDDLAALVRLQRLTLEHGGIERLDGIERLRAVRELRLRRLRRLTSLAGVERLKLTTLEVTGCPGVTPGGAAAPPPRQPVAPKSRRARSVDQNASSSQGSSS